MNRSTRLTCHFCFDWLFQKYLKFRSSTFWTLFDGTFLQTKYLLNISMHIFGISYAHIKGLELLTNYPETLVGFLMPVQSFMLPIILHLSGNICIYSFINPALIFPRMLRYFLASFIHAQIFRGLCEITVFGKVNSGESLQMPLHRCDIYGSKRAGKIIKYFILHKIYG